MFHDSPYRMRTCRRMMLMTVVKPPRENMRVTSSFLRRFNFSFHNSGIGKAKTTRSRAMLMAALVNENNQSVIIRPFHDEIILTKPMRLDLDSYNGLDVHHPKRAYLDPISTQGAHPIRVFSALTRSEQPESIETVSPTRRLLHSPRWQQWRCIPRCEIASHRRSANM